MDILVYISELLGQNGVLIVPGLGIFSRVRSDGFYNKDKQLFFPPSILLQFKVDDSDDDVLSRHIAHERSISAASARYFIEKFVNNLKEKLEDGQVDFGDLGVFSMRRNQLVFTPIQKIDNNEQFYGLAPVKLKRNSVYRQQTVDSPLAEKATEPITVPITPAIIAEQPAELPPPIIPAPPAIAPEPETETFVSTRINPERPAASNLAAAEEETSEEVAPRRKVSAWLIVALIFVVLGLGLILTYQLKPSLFKGLIGIYTPGQKAEQKAKTDSLTEAAEMQKNIGVTPTVTDTTAAALQKNTSSPAMPADTFGLVVESFKTYASAAKGLPEYIQKGYRPVVRKNPDTKRYEIDLATFLSLDSATEARTSEMAKLKKQPQDVNIQEYPHHK